MSADTPTTDDVRCCCLDDFEYMEKEGHAAYPEVFFAGKVDLYEMAKALRDVARSLDVSMPASARFLISTAGFILAKQCGWRVPTKGAQP